MALFVLNFLNLPQRDVLTKAKNKKQTNKKRSFETLKDTSCPLPI